MKIQGVSVYFDKVIIGKDKIVLGQAFNEKNTPVKLNNDTLKIAIDNLINSLWNLVF